MFRKWLMGYSHSGFLEPGFLHKDCILTEKSWKAWCREQQWSEDWSGQFSTCIVAPFQVLQALRRCFCQIAIPGQTAMFTGNVRTGPHLHHVFYIILKYHWFLLIVLWNVGNSLLGIFPETDHIPMGIFLGYDRCRTAMLNPVIFLNVSE